MPDEKAAKVVEAIEEFLAVKDQGSDRRARHEADGHNWLIGSLGSIIAIGVLISALSPIITKLIH